MGKGKEKRGLFQGPLNLRVVTRVTGGLTKGDLRASSPGRHPQTVGQGCAGGTSDGSVEVLSSDLRQNCSVS